MKKIKFLAFFALFCLISAGMASAQSTRPLKAGRYACNGSNLSMELHSNGIVNVSINGANNRGSWATGTYRISEDGKRITLSINRTNGDLSALQGMTMSYAIYNTEVFFNDAEEWIYIGK